MLLIGSKLAIKGDWDVSVVPNDRVVVTLTPSPHSKIGNPYAPWTRSMLEAIEVLVVPGMTVIDFGAGNGILALAAAKLGATTVYAIERSEMPSHVARVNIMNNELSDIITFIQDDFTNNVSLPSSADLIVANFDNLDALKFIGELSKTRLNIGQHFLMMPETHNVNKINTNFTDFTLVEQISVGDRWSRLDFIL